MIERADVEVLDLLDGKQREAPAPGHAAGDVVRLVEVRRRDDRGADPQARLDARVQQGQHVVGLEARHAAGDQRALHRHRGRARELRVAQGLLEDAAHRLQRAQVVEARHRGVVEDAALLLGRRHQRVDGRTVVEGRQVLRDGERRLARARDRGPAGDESAQDRGLVARQDLVVEDVAGDVAPFGDCGKRRGHEVVGAALARTRARRWFKHSGDSPHRAVQPGGRGPRRARFVPPAAGRRGRTEESSVSRRTAVRNHVAACVCPAKDQ